MNSFKKIRIAVIIIITNNVGHDHEYIGDMRVVT